MSSLGPVIITRVLSASNEAVWAQFEDRAKRDAWWKVDLDLTLGGSVVELESPAEPRSGAVDVIERGEILGFRWRAPHDEFETTVIVRIERGDEGGSVITVIETGLAALADPHSRVDAADRFWNRTLDQLITVSRPGTAALVPVDESQVGEIVDGEVFDDESDDDDAIEVVVSDEELLEIEQTIDAEPIPEWEVIVDEQARKSE